MQGYHLASRVATALHHVRFRLDESLECCGYSDRLSLPILPREPAESVLTSPASSRVHAERFVVVSSVAL